jgi:S-DNA-T family DNA segregation ATPase FtsK/SpoIIIE
VNVKREKTRRGKEKNLFACGEFFLSFLDPLCDSFRRVKFLRHQGSPNYDVQPSTLAEASNEADQAESGHEDDLFESAVRLVVTGGSASTSMLQRRFKIGYTRAARLVDMMEQKGIVGALDGAKPREILISRDEMEAMFGTPDMHTEE